MQPSTVQTTTMTTTAKKAFNAPFTHSKTKYYTMLEPLHSHVYDVDFTEDGNHMFVVGEIWQGMRAKPLATQWNISYGGEHSWITGGKLPVMINNNNKEQQQQPLTLPNGRIQILHVGNCLSELCAHEGPVIQAVAVSHNYVATAGYNKKKANHEFFIWRNNSSLSSLQIEKILPYNKLSRITALKFNTTGTLLASGDDGGNIIIWNAHSGWQIVFDFPMEGGGYVLFLRWITPETLLCKTLNGIQAITLNNENKSAASVQVSKIQTQYYCFNCSNDCRSIYFGHTSIYQLQNNNPQKLFSFDNVFCTTPNVHQGKIIVSLCVCPDDSILATVPAVEDSTPSTTTSILRGSSKITLWSLPNFVPLIELDYTIESKNIPINKICFDSSGNWLCVVGDKGSLSLWERDNSDSSRQPFENGIFHVLSQVQPGYGIDYGGTTIVNTLILSVESKILEEMEKNRRTNNNNNQQLTVEHVEMALQTILNVGEGALLKHALSECKKAVMKWKTKCGEGNNSNVLVKGCMLTTPQAMKESCSLHFVPSTQIILDHIQDYLISSNNKNNIDGGGGVNIATITEDVLVCIIASLEYLAAEILELGGNHTRVMESQTVSYFDIYNGIWTDNELKQLLLEQ
jgi:WD40 repeat protein